MKNKALFYSAMLMLATAHVVAIILLWHSHWIYAPLAYIALMLIGNKLIRSIK